MWVQPIRDLDCEEATRAARTPSRRNRRWEILADARDTVKAAAKCCDPISRMPGVSEMSLRRG